MDSKKTRIGQLRTWWNLSYLGRSQKCKIINNLRWIPQSSPGGELFLLDNELNSWITYWYWQHYLCLNCQLESWCQNLQLWSIIPIPMNWSSSMFLTHWMLGWSLCVQNTHSSSLPILPPCAGRQLGDTRLGIDWCLLHILDWLNILGRE